MRPAHPALASEDDFVVEREGWLGEVEGFQISLADANNKLGQIDRHRPTTVVDLPTPLVRREH
jgi:hypothetical protein